MAMRRWRARSGRLAAATILALLLAGAAAAQEKVRVDAGLHEGYARLVFDWRTNVPYETKLDGNKLTIHFARPLAVDLSGLTRRAGEYVESAELSGNSDVVITLRRSVTLRPVAVEPKVAIDLVDKPEAAP